MREGTIRPLHTPGVYTTPVAFISAFVFVQDLSFRRSNSQKQSINDAFQYVAVPPIPPGGVGMNDAKIQKHFEILRFYSEKTHYSEEKAISGCNI